MVTTQFVVCVVTIALFGLISIFLAGDTIFVGQAEMAGDVEIGIFGEKFEPVVDSVEITLPVARIFCCSMNSRCSA